MTVGSAEDAQVAPGSSEEPFSSAWGRMGGHRTDFTLILLALLAALLTAAVLAPRLSRPVDGSLSGPLFSYQTLFARNWDEHGFRTLRGIPCVGIGRGPVLELEPYLHHPVLTYWMMYGARQIWGWHEWAFRLPGAVASALAAFVTVLLAGRVVNRGRAFLAGAAFATLPLTFAYGDLTNPEPWVVLGLLVGFWLRERIRERPSRLRFWALALFFVVAAQWDWQVYFLGPALFLSELLRPRGTRRFAELWALGPFAVIALALTLGHFAWGIGEFESLKDHVLGTALTTLEGRDSRTWQGFLKVQYDVARVDLGWPVAALLASLPLFALLRPRSLRTPGGAMMIGLFVPVILNFVLFRVPAYDHRFYWMPALAGIPLAVAIADRAFARWSPALAGLFLLGVFGSSLVVNFGNERARDLSNQPDREFREIAKAVNAFAEARDLVLTPEEVGPTMFYCRARLYDTIDTVAKLNRILDRSGDRDSLFFFVFDWHLERYAELARHLDQSAERRTFPGLVVWVRRLGATPQGK